MTFTEYEYGSLSGKRRIYQRLENMLVAAVIQPGEALGKDRIEEYFGEDIPGEVARVLAQSPVLRLILQDDNQQNYCVSLVDAFLNTGAQTIEFGQRAVPEPQAPPSYLQFMNMFGAQNQEPAPPESTY